MGGYEDPTFGHVQPRDPRRPTGRLAAVIDERCSSASAHFAAGMGHPTTPARWARRSSPGGAHGLPPGSEQRLGATLFRPPGLPIDGGVGGAPAPGARHQAARTGPAPRGGTCAGPGTTRTRRPCAVRSGASPRAGLALTPHADRQDGCTPTRKGHAIKTVGGLVRLLISCQEGLLPGRDFAEKLHNAEAYGFDAVELNGGALADDAGRAERRQALASSRVKASSICGGVNNRFVDVDPAERARSRESLRRQLAYAAEVGARGPIFVPIFSGNNHMPDLRPVKSKWDLCRDVMVELLHHIDADAREAGAIALMEPLNRYEANFLNRLEQAKGMIAEAGAQHVRIMADFFHMSIEESNIAAAIEGAGALIAHVHLADSNRKEPGAGMTDFVSGFRALRQIGFQGAMAFECGLSGPREQALPQSVAYLRKCLAEAGA